MNRPAVNMTTPVDAVTIRPAQAQDLAAMNGVVERAVMGWEVPERVKRLSLPSYRYQPLDFAFMEIVVAEAAGSSIVGVAAWEEASQRDVPAGKCGLLLHGLYVDPARQRQGIGSRLLDAAQGAARKQGFDGLLVRAQRDANGFFASRGLRQMPVEDHQRDYPNRYWQSC